MSAKKGNTVVVIIASVCIVSFLAACIFSLSAFAHNEEKPKNETTVSESSQISSETKTDTSSEKIENAAGKAVKAFLSPYIAKVKHKNIYLNNRTGTDIDIKSIYETPPNIKIEKGAEPEVLILHTHATEGYMTEDKDYYTQADIDQTEDSDRSVIMVGETVCRVLGEYGITAIHDKTLHDNPSYTNSYNRSAETVKKYMEKYPSIKIVIDIHRDSVSTDGGLVRCVSEQNGQDAAQIMFVTGSQTGNVTGFDNWMENLRLVLRLQEISETLYPGLARAIYFTSKKYNQHLSTGSLLIEVGSSVNTVSEAKYTAELLGRILGVGLNLYAEG